MILKNEILHVKRGLNFRSLVSLFPQAELAEELGDEFVWCGVTSDFAEDFPSASHIDLEKIYRHTHFQALVDGLQTFQSFFNQGNVTGVG